MKQTSKSKPAAEPAAPVVAPWRPTWRWHLKALAAVYAFIAVFYFAVDRWLSHLPQPYRLRDVPAEMTPWLKK